MKVFKSCIFLVSIIILSVFVGCSKSDENNPMDPGNGGGGGGGSITGQAQITLNGGEFSNKVFTFSKGIGAYSVGDAVTSMTFLTANNSDSLVFYILFSGNTAATRNWGTDNAITLSIKSSGSSKTFLGITNGSTTVTNYGAVGGKLEGNVSGKILESSANPTEVTISGTFSALRMPDAQ